MRKPRNYALFLLSLGTLSAFPRLLPAQQENGEQVEELGDVTVKATRVEKSSLRVPAAVSVIDQNEIQLGMQQLGLDESMRRVPGLFFQDRYNFAQDLRIAIRGFGARSNFGIRGI